MNTGLVVGVSREGGGLKVEGCRFRGLRSGSGWHWVELVETVRASLLRLLRGSPALGLEKVVRRCSVQECFNLDAKIVVRLLTVLFPK